MLDRKVSHVLSGIDIHVEVPRVDYENWGSDCLGESYASMREQVQAARERQRFRFEGWISFVPCGNRDYAIPMCVAEVRRF